jgi:hypothetical protein
MLKISAKCGYISSPDSHREGSRLNITIMPFKITRECFGSKTVPTTPSASQPPLLSLRVGGEKQKKAALMQPFPLLSLGSNQGPHD